MVKSVFHLRVMFFEIAQVLPHIWATFKGKFVTKNLKKLPNLVALRVKKNENSNFFHSKVAAASNSVTRRAVVVAQLV